MKPFYDRKWKFRTDDPPSDRCKKSVVLLDGDLFNPFNTNDAYDAIEKIWQSKHTYIAVTNFPGRARSLMRGVISGYENPPQNLVIGFRMKLED